MKKKILIFANESNSLHNNRIELITLLGQKGVEIVAACQVLFFEEALKNVGCRVINISTNRHSKNPFNDLFLLAKYIKFVIKEKPDCVFTYSIKPNVYGGIVCGLFNIPCLANITGLGTAVEFPGLTQVISVALLKIGLFKSICVFFQNKDNQFFFTQKKILRSTTRQCLIPGSGVNLIKHKYFDYPTDDKTTIFLFSGRIMREKGIEYIIGAAKRLNKMNKNFLIYLCGYCEDKEMLNLLKITNLESPNVIYKGEQKDMTLFYKQSHCILHPSYYPEGMSNTLLESAAHGRPIITTDRAGCREAVDNNATGYIIPIKDEDALFKAMIRFIDLPLQEKRNMGLLGRKKMEKEFDRRIVIDAYLKILNLIIPLV